LCTELLSILETELNFTTKFYKRQDGIWGLATIDKITGKLNASGMLTDLVSGKADMIATNLAIIYERSFALDYLHPLSSVYVGLFIRNDKTFDDMDFITYLEPLSNQLWPFIFFFFFYKHQAWQRLNIMVLHSSRINNSTDIYTNNKCYVVCTSLQMLLLSSEYSTHV
jgi:hypothetical protein